MTPTAAPPESTVCSTAKAVIRTERDAIDGLLTRIGPDFATACDLLLHTKGRVIVIGIGKSGHIGKKIAATLASTGTPAYYIHPSEASHGDLGMIMRNDTVLMISNSGETHELLHIIPVITQQSIPIISMTGTATSTLAQCSNVHIDIGVDKEAGSLGLAPSASTTATLVMGDALALAVLEARGFTSEDFAFYHPGGRLGRQLLLTVTDLMHKENEIPTVTPDTTVSQALLEITQKRLGMTTIVDTNHHLLGIFTDGDLRRSLDNNDNIHSTPIQAVMTPHCQTITPDMLVRHALELMRQRQITTLVVLNTTKKVVGVLHMHDILRAGITA